MTDRSGREAAKRRTNPAARQSTQERETAESEPRPTERALTESGAEETPRSRNRADRSAEELAIIANIGRLIGSSLNIDEVYERFAVEAHKLIPFDRLTVTIAHVHGDTFEVAYVSGLAIRGLMPGNCRPLRGTLTEAVLRTRTGLLVQPADTPEGNAEILARFPALSADFPVGLPSIVSVPLIYRDEAIGVLHFLSKTTKAYTEKDLRLAEEIGTWVAGAVANAQLFNALKKEETQQRIHRESAERLADEMSVIAEIGRLIGSSLDISDVYERFANEARKLIPFDRIHVNLNNDDGKTLTIVYVSGFDIPGRKPGDRVPLTGTVSEVVGRTRTGLLFHPQRVNDIVDRFPNASSAVSYRAGMRSMMAIPLIARDEVIGVLHFRSKLTNVYNDRHLRTAERIGAQIAGAIANAQLFSALRTSEEEERKNRGKAERLAEESAVIAEIGKVIGSSLDINEVYERIASETKKLLPFDRLAINPVTPHENIGSIAYTSGVDIAGLRLGDSVQPAGSLSEIVLRTKEALLINTTGFEDMAARFPGVTHLASIRAGMRSIICIPLIHRDEVIGILHIRSKTINAYGEQEFELAKKIGAHVAGAIANARLFAELKKSGEEQRIHRSQAESLARELSVIAEIGRLIGSTLEIQEVYEAVARQARKLVPFDRLSVDLQVPGEEKIILTYISGDEIPDRRPGDTVPLAGTISETILRMRTSLLIHTTGVDDMTRRFPHFTNLATIRAGMLSMVSVPLIFRDAVIGTLHFRSKQPNAYTERDLQLAERIGAQIAGAIAGARLYAELRETEQSLRRSEDRYRTLFNEAHDGIALADRETGELLDCNEALCRLVGRTKQELIGLSQAILHPEQILNKGNTEGFRLHSAAAQGLVTEETLLSKQGRLIPVDVRTARAMIGGRDCLLGIFRDITDRKQAERSLRETLDQLESRVRERTIELEETNTALRVLIKNGDMDQKKLEENLQTNIDQLVTPFLSRLRSSRSDQERLTYLNILETNLGNILSPFINKLSAAYRSLTPKEIQIAELIRQGRTSKEIAQVFGISVGTVITHRNNIRKKLHLKSINANLRSHLLSVAQHMN